MKTILGALPGARTAETPPSSNARTPQYSDLVRECGRRPEPGLRRRGASLPIGARIALIATIAVIASAHVGTDDVFFSGAAGPWPVRVSIRQPGVIPGLADINVRIEADSVSRVLVTALRRVANSGEAPPPDVATPVRGAPGLYAAQLWLMTRGPHEVVVTIEGDRGTGEARVPVMARATRRLAMTRGLRNLLFAGGAILVLGLLTLIGAATRESVLPPGQAPGRPERRRARIAVAAAGLTLGVLLFGGWTWIRAEAAGFSRRIDRPWSVTAAVATIDGHARLDLSITDSLWIMRDDPAWLARHNRYRRADLTADHGKLMHMFLVREPGLDAFAHVHPVTSDANRFSVAVPPLPAGHYRVYADIAEEDGSAQTLVASVDLSEPPAGLDAPRTTGGGAAPTPRAGQADEAAAQSGNGVPEPDPDDSWWAATAQTGDDTFRLEWVNRDEELIAGTDAELRFQLSSPDGSPRQIQPYMGMAGHAMLNREDGKVFLHLHPSGMISMAAQQAMQAADAQATAPDADSASAAMAGMSGVAGGPHTTAPAGSVSFPLVAPPSGRYRAWVQVRANDRIVTRAFDVTVH